MKTESILLERVNALVAEPFTSLEACLAHYRGELPERVGDYHQEEVGPIYHHEGPGEADLFVRKIFHLGQATLDMSAGIDWLATPNGDLEWNGGLVRHGYFVLLANEFHRTGRLVYAQTIVEHLLDYCERVPVFDPVGRPYLDFKRSTWRPFEVACRVAETWPVALAKIIGSPAMTAEAWAKILLAIHQHAVFLRQHHWTTGNHATLEVADLGIVAIFFREFREHPAWLRYAVGFLDGMWDKLFHSDGYSREMSGSYHWVALRSYVAFFAVARRNGEEGLFSPAYRERLRLAARAEYRQDKPDFSTPITNDSNTRINRREQLERLARILDLPEIEYVLTGGQSGIEPTATSTFFPAARLGVMRSDWSATARYLCFDMGPWGDNHMNQDQLCLEVSALGRHFLVNGGKWRYTTSDPQADWMPLAKYFKNTAAYNCVLVNGYGQVFGDALGTMLVGPDFDYADGSFAAGFGEEVPGRDEELFRERGLATRMENRLPGVVHRRQVFFIKPHGWIIRDTVSGPGLVRAEQVWHGMEGDFLPLAGAPGVWHTDFSGPNLWITSVGNPGLSGRVLRGQKEPFFAGWHCPYYDVLQPAPELRLLQEGTGRIIFHTLLLPISGRAETAPAFRLLMDGYEVSGPGFSARVHAPEEGPWSPASSVF